MNSQINLKLTKNFHEQAKHYAKTHGFLNVQEFFREAAREKIFENTNVKDKYKKRLNSKEANTFLSNANTKEFEKELEARANLNETKNTRK